MVAHNAADKDSTFVKNNNNKIIALLLLPTR